VLDEWPTDEEVPACFSTIATWENKGKNISFGGETYVWSKHVNFLRFLDLPRRSGQAFEMAMLPPDEAVRREVSEAGWRLVDPRPVSADMGSYAGFIAGSRGEFTVAKDIYVRPKSGWFSDRSVCYLASGRPVVTMNTGWTRFYPSGEGLFGYETTEEALAALGEVASDYRRHGRAARDMAASYFGSDRVLAPMMAACGL
jgi:hypothetical protein